MSKYDVLNYLESIKKNSIIQIRDVWTMLFFCAKKQL